LLPYEVHVHPQPVHTDLEVLQADVSVISDMAIFLLTGDCVHTSVVVAAREKSAAAAILGRVNLVPTAKMPAWTNANSCG
jgi:hypothetical protein